MLEQHNKIKYISFDIFKDLDFINCKISTKHGGVSKGNYESMNLSFTIGDEIDNVYKNYFIFANELGFNYEKMQRGFQTHSTNAIVVTEAKPFSENAQYANTDMLQTNLVNTPLVTLFADCVPLFLVDKKNKAICVVHAGWRGTVNEIATKAVINMRENFGTQKDDLLVGIGPSIHSCCFLVDDDVYSEFYKHEEYRQYIKTLENKYSIDLQKVNKHNLLKTGLVHERNIEIIDYCTCCNEDLFFSHRRENVNRGSLAGFLEIVK